MNLRVTTSTLETGIVLLHLAGHMTIGPETDNLEWLLRSLLREGQTKLILDLAGVDQIDPDAAVFLVRCFFVAREIGIRLALGAGRPDVLRLILKQGLKLTSAGIVLGLAIAYGLTRALASLLFGVKASDPFTFAVVAVILSVIAVAATFFPARQASAVEPAEALRYQ